MGTYKFDACQIKKFPLKSLTKYIKWLSYPGLPEGRQQALTIAYVIIIHQNVINCQSLFFVIISVNAYYKHIFS